MPSNSDLELRKEIMKLTKEVETIENNFKNHQEEFNKKIINQEDFEGIKLNLAEEIRKVRYEITQLRAKINVKNEREGLILEQLDELSEQFQTDIDEETGIATIFLEVSLDIHYEIDIDCSKYPQAPYLFIPKELDDFFDGKIVRELKTLQKWSMKKPTPLVEIFEEIEEKLIEFFLEDIEMIDDREKIAHRRKLIGFARDAENKGNFDEAIIIYSDILKISKELNDKRSYLRYRDKLKEVKAYSRAK